MDKVPVPPNGVSLLDLLLVDAPTWAAAVAASRASRSLRAALLSAVGGLVLPWWDNPDAGERACMKSGCSFLRTCPQLRRGLEVWGSPTDPWFLLRWNGAGTAGAVAGAARSFLPTETAVVPRLAREDEVPMLLAVRQHLGADVVRVVIVKEEPPSSGGGDAATGSFPQLQRLVHYDHARGDAKDQDLFQDEAFGFWRDQSAIRTARQTNLGSVWVAKSVPSEFLFAPCCIMTII